MDGMDRLGALGAFVQAADAGSFTAAGRALGVSASAIGKAVARLEQRLGVRLFHRSTRAISLTPEGALFLERCRRIFCEMEAAEVEIARTRDAPHGRLRVSLPLVGMLMMPTLGAFMRAWPRIELDLDFTDRLVNVVDEGFDAVIRTGEATDSRLKSRTIGRFRHRIVAAPAYLARHGTPDAPEALAGHACLHHRYPSTGRLEPWPLQREGQPLAPALPRTAVASAVEPLIDLAEQGLGLACLPDFAIRRQLAAGTLVPVLDAYLGGAGAFRILWPCARHTSPRLRVFVDFVAARLFAADAD